MFKVLAPLAMTVLLGACSAPSNTVPAPPPDMHTSRTSVDWAGSYAGTLPCADCPGIRVKLTLNSNETYEQSTLYEDRQAKPEVTRGNFRWLPDNGSIFLEGEETRWRVGENQLTMLDQEGQVITGALADFYVLKRVAP